MSDEPNAETEPARPALRVVRGDPTPEEIAALVAVLAAGSGGDDPAPPRRHSAWSAPAGLIRGPVTHGPGGWRGSARPH